MISDDQRKAVVSEALTWQGTPYHHQSALKGVGADCGLFPIAVYRSIGLLNDFQVPEYSPQWFMHRQEELYLEYAHKLGAADTEELLPGNFLIFKIGRTFSHGAIIVNWPHVIHSMAPRGVILSDAERESVLIRKAYKVLTA
jgi:cell wall-associated NlpC family hydrolase